MPVPFIDLARTVKYFRDDVLKDWERCLDNTEFVGGPTVAKLEGLLAKKLEVPHFIACANGTDALVIGLQALGVKAGMKVAVPNMTFWSPFEAIVQIGAEPVLIDIDEDDLQMCFDEFKKAHEKFRFDAAILVHLFGWSSQNLLEYRRFCDERGIRLLEDGAQAFGVKVDGESVYKGAKIGTISFYPAKVMGGSSDGGGFTCQDTKTMELIRSLCNHGRAGHYNYDYVGWNSRIGGLQASYLSRFLEHIDHFLKSRREGEQFYQEYFAAHDQLARTYRAPANMETNGYLSVICGRKKTGEELSAALNQKKIGNARTYPQTLDAQPPAAKALRISELKRSHRFSKHVINLPLFADITIDECKSSADALRDALEGK